MISNNPSNNYQEAQEWVKIQREDGVKICFTNGVYDILTAGHIAFLMWLDQALGSGVGPDTWAVMVGINADESVKAVKGKFRPVNTLEDRLAVMHSLWMVDAIVMFQEPTPIELIRVVKPDALAKGGDYKDVKIVGQDLVEAAGGSIMIGPMLEGRSTSKAIDLAYRSNHPCPGCGGSGEAGANGIDPNNPHDTTCVNCRGRGYV